LIQKSSPELVMTTRPNTANSVELRCDTKPFTDINVRIALQMALDLPTIAKTIYQGTVEPIPSALVNPANKLFSYQYSDWPQSLKDEYAYNPTKAKQLLAAAGYPNGFDTNIVASAGGGGMIPTDPNLLLIIKDYFKAIGVNMEIREMEPATLTSFVAAGKHDQMVYFGMAQTSVPYPNNVRWRLSTNLASNYTYNMDKAYDALFNAVATSASFEDYKKAVIACDKYAFEKHWSVTTFPVPSYTFYAPRFKGVDSAEIAMVTYPGIEFARVWLAQK
jgi:ABC-type transport system substrate-binding protein